MTAVVLPREVHAIETAGEILADGTVLELVRDRANANALQVLKWREKALDQGFELSIGDRAYKPIAISPSYATALRFPSYVAPPESTRHLFEDVCSLLKLFLGQPDSSFTAMALAVFASWFAPVLPVAPILAIFAPPGSAKELALRLLALLCRRPLRLAGIKRADLLRVPVGLGATLLLYEPTLSPQLQDVLKAGVTRGLLVADTDGVREIFGPKILISSRPFVGTALEPVLRVSLMPTLGELPRLDKNAEEQIANEFQARLLGHFLRNFNRVETPNIDVSELAQPLQETARAFGAAVAGDPELLLTIVALLRVPDEEIRAERDASFDSLLLEASLLFIHKGETNVRANATAEMIEALCAGRGLDLKISAERVGWAWKRLAIPSGRIDRDGNGITLNAPTCKRIHELAVAYGVRAIPSALRTDCPHCREIKAAITPPKM